MFICIHVRRFYVAKMISFLLPTFIQTNINLDLPFLITIYKIRQYSRGDVHYSLAKFAKLWHFDDLSKHLFPKI